MNYPRFTLAFILLVGFIVPLYSSAQTSPSSIQDLVSVIVSQTATGEQKARASALLVRHGRPAVPPLLRVLSSPDVANSRFYAIYALGCLKSPDAVEPLCRILSDRTYGPRRYAAIALGNIRSQTAVKTLATALNDASYVSDDAIDALIKIDSAAARKALEDFYFSASDPGFHLILSFRPGVVRIGDAVVVQASISNRSKEAAVLTLYDGVPRCNAVIRRANGSFVRHTIASLPDRPPARVTRHVVNPGDTYRWTMKGEATRIAILIDDCEPTGQHRTSNALILDSKAFLVLPNDDLRIRAIVDLDSAAGGGSLNNKRCRRVVSAEASLGVH